MMRHGLPPNCPGCGQLDSVQRVRGLVASRNDDAANAMRAPQPPGPARPGGSPWPWLAFLWFVVALIILAVSAQRDRTGLVGLFAWMIALGVPVAFAIYQIGGTHRRKLARQFKAEAHQVQLEDYGRALRVWDQLEFCLRCNAIFLPENEWQWELNQSREPISPHNAWWYASNLAWQQRNKESRVIAVSGPGPTA